PPAAVSSTSSRSVQICTSTIASLSSSFMAMMPERRTSTKSDSLLRRTLPPVVANITSSSPQVDSSSGSGMMVVMRSPCSSGRMLISALPRAFGAALAAAALRPIGRQRHALDVTRMRDGDDHFLALDQVLVLDLALLLDDHGAARGGELGLHLGEFGLDDVQHAGARAQDIEIIAD